MCLLGSAGDALGQRLLSLVEVDLEVLGVEGPPAERRIVRLAGDGDGEQEGGGEEELTHGRDPTPSDMLWGQGRRRAWATGIIITTATIEVTITIAVSGVVDTGTTVARSAGRIAPRWPG